MKKFGKYLLIFGFIMCLIIFAAGCGEKATSDGKKIEIKFSHVVAPTTPKGLAAQKFADLVAEKSNGRIEIKVYPSSQLYGDKDELEALQTNNIQIIAPSAGKLVALDPRFQLPDIPFLFKNEQASNKFWDGPGGQQLFAGLESKGIKGLASWPNGMRNWINGKKAIKSPSDLKGLKFRIPSGGVLTELHEELNAGAVGIPFAEVYTGLQQGTIDGTVASLDNIKSERYHEVIKNITIADINSLNYVVLANAGFWNGLADEDRAILEEALKEATVYERELSLEKNSFTKGSELEKIFTEAKVEIVELTDAEKKVFKEALKGVLEKYTPIIGEDLIKLAEAANL
ncbi:MAG: C4-dicarboxylate ABC transporter [Clostridiaceae bacterium BRH_c20a]|nr:MAG: C4-dicarboxylate ABC transporter [Clostridiaceae bacterium BRH_c20a]